MLTGSLVENVPSDTCALEIILMQRMKTMAEEGKGNQGYLSQGAASIVAVPFNHSTPIAT